MASITNLNSKTKSRISTWLLGAFSLILLLTAFYTELFQRRKEELQFTHINHNPFSETFLKTAKSIELKNKLGNYKIERIMPFEQNKWQLKVPKDLQAEKRTVNKILNSLYKINLKNVYDKDKINIQNYSLDNPLVSLSIRSEIRTINMKVGLVNPINNSAYISFSHIDKIFQVDRFKFSMESIVLTDLIDAHVLDINNEDIQKIEIFSGNSNRAFFKIYKVGSDWFDSKNRQLDLEKVVQYTSTLKALKSSLILDRQTKKTKKYLNRMFKYPAYKLIISDHDQKQIIKITGLITSKKQHDIKIQKKKNFAVLNDKKPNPFILSKHYFNYFKKKESSLRPSL
ncbi:MAG: hypothetical protein ACI9QD_000247 [Thermoproteota archaeon]|jgi:hypothetical protein